MLHKDALPELDSLIHPTYEGTEGGKHFFVNWSKVSVEPFKINHFALDTSLCFVDLPLSRSDENYRKISETRPMKRETRFHNGDCSVSEPREMSASLHDTATKN